jgi:kynurenine formamidase
MTLEELVAPIVVVDISWRVAREPDTVVTPEDLERFERRHGRIPKGAVVAMYSGWETRAGSVEAYRNTDATGTMRFPGFGKEAVDWLLERRRIRGIGVDTMSLDHGSSSTFDVHLTVLSADRYGVENLRNLKQIPARGATVVLGLIPWREGSGGACRAFALTR